MEKNNEMDNQKGKEKTTVDHTEVFLYLCKIWKECLACATSQSIPIASWNKVLSFSFKHLQNFQEAQTLRGEEIKE